MLIWEYLVSLLLILIILLHNPAHMKRLIVYFYVICLKMSSKTIWIQVQPDPHQTELGEAHSLSLSGNFWQNIFYKHAQKEDYRIVDSLHNIRKEDAEFSKWIQHGCDLILIWNTWNITTRTAIPSPEDNVLSSTLMKPIITKYWTDTNATDMWYNWCSQWKMSQFFWISQKTCVYENLTKHRKSKQI